MKQSSLLTLLLALSLLLAPLASASSPDATPWQNEAPDAEAVQPTDAELPADAPTLDLEIQEPLYTSAPGPCEFTCPGGIALICPNFPGLPRPTCDANECCVYE